MIKKPRFPTPHHHVTVLKHQPLKRIAALQAAKLEDRRQAQRNRHNRRTQIRLVFVLM
ncbi:hypothetical protein D3C71_2057710 [compost metagenome]